MVLGYTQYSPHFLLIGSLSVVRNSGGSGVDDFDADSSSVPTFETLAESSRSSVIFHGQKSSLRKVIRELFFEKLDQEQHDGTRICCPGLM